LRLPGGFVPDEDQGISTSTSSYPWRRRSTAPRPVNDKLDAIFKTTPGIKYYTGVAGFSLLSLVTTTYNSFYFVTLDDWDARNKKGLTADVIIRHSTRSWPVWPRLRSSPSRRPPSRASERPAA